MFREFTIESTRLRQPVMIGVLPGKPKLLQEQAFFRFEEMHTNAVQLYARSCSGAYRSHRQA
jgi:hypothetical protein